MKKRIHFLTWLSCLALIGAAEAYPPAPYYRIYGSVRDELGNPLASGDGTVILSGIYSALGSASVNDLGQITQVYIPNGGSGFTSAPTVTFFGAQGTGTGAVGVATLTDGVVTGVSLTAPGENYSAPVIVGVTGGGAPPLEIVRATTSTSVGRGLNYALPVPMDSNTSALLYEETALRPWLPFTIRVLINGVNYVPMQIAAATSPVWAEQINQQNAPTTIRTQGSHWAVGLPADKLRLDLWLGVDSNNDCLPDAWQWSIVNSDPTGQLTDFTQVDPNVDLSGNGLTVKQEYLLGIYPLEPLDGLNFTIVSVVDQVVRLRFQAIVGRTYRLKSSPDLKTWLDPQPFGLSDALPALQSYFTADSSRLLDVWVPVEDAAQTHFRLYAE